jgi:hypothetical protein
MDSKPPAPVCHSFLICRQLFQDQASSEIIIIGPAYQLVAIQFPVIGQLSVYARVTSLHGLYILETQLRDFDGTIHWRQRFENTLECHDPLAITNITLRDLRVTFPGPGKYEFVLLANDDEVARDIFGAQFPNLQSSPSA